jgi:hypothetical protein
MPRPPEDSTLRRAFKQTIMWLVLAATIGTAAWVDASANKLADAVRFDGITLRLPKGLVPTSDHDGTAVIELRERGGHPAIVRTFTVRRVAFSLRSIFRGPPTRTEQFKLDDGVAAKLSVVSTHIGNDEESGESWKELEVLAVFTPPGSEPLVIGLRQLTFDEPSDAKRNVRLIKQILETVRFVKDEG